MWGQILKLIFMHPSLEAYKGEESSDGLLPLCSKPGWDIVADNFHGGYLCRH